MRKILLVKILFIIGYLLISGGVHSAPPTIEGIEESYEVHGYETLRIRVKAKDAEGDPLTIVWTQTAGKPLWKKAPSGFDINLLIPADLGEDQVFEITATVSDGTNETAFNTTITMLEYQEKFVFFDMYERCGEEEKLEDSDACSEIPPPTDITLDFLGFNRYGVFKSSEFDQFEIKMVSETGAVLVFDELLDIILSVVDAGAVVTDMFAVDEANGILYIKEDRLAEFMSWLKKSDEDRFHSSIELSISGRDSLGNIVAKEIHFKYGYGVIKGTLVDKEGKAYRGLEGESVYLKATIRGGSMGTSLKRGGYSALIGEDGKFEIRNLPVGVYTVLLETQDGLSAVAVPVNINLGAPNADISMEVRDINAPVAVSEPLSNAVNRQVKTQSVSALVLGACPRTKNRLQIP